MAILTGFLAATAHVGAVDVALYTVVKAHHSEQLTAGTPSIPTTNGYSFQAVVLFSTTNAVTNATVDTPNNQTKTLSPRGALALTFEERFDNAGTLDATYPHAGFFQSYIMTMNTANDGTSIQSLAYVFASLYPVTPQVVNWEAAQEVDHTVDFTLEWQDLGGDPLNPAGVSILDPNGTLVFTTPEPSATNALNGASNSVVIPAHTLNAGTDFDAYLSIGRVSGQPNTNYAVGAPLLARETRFPMRTRPAPVAPTLDLTAQENGSIEVRVTGESNRTYQILSTTNWMDWQLLLITNSVSGEVQFAEPNGATPSQRFYRAKVGQ